MAPNRKAIPIKNVSNLDETGEFTISSAGKSNEKQVAASMTPALKPVVAFWKRGEILDKPIAGKAPTVVANEVVKKANNA